MTKSPHHTEVESNMAMYRRDLADVWLRSGDAESSYRTDRSEGI